MIKFKIKKIERNYDNDRKAEQQLGLCVCALILILFLLVSGVLFAPVAKMDCFVVHFSSLFTDEMRFSKSCIAEM